MTTLEGLSQLRAFLRLHGRTAADEDDGAVFFNWTCSGFTVRFTGRTLRARLRAYSAKPPMEPDGAEEHPWIGIISDGGVKLARRLECNEPSAWYELFETDSDGPHTVRVVKLSENTMGKVGVAALETTGQFLPCEPSGERLNIEFVGDSITCGFGNEAPGRDSPFKASEENGWASFAAVAARELDAEFQCVAVSGISACAPKRPMFPLEPMDAIYAYADYFHDKLKGREPRLWRFDEHRQDALVVNLGTNDVNPVRFYSELEAADEEEAHFYERYKAFLKALRRLNGPQTLICCTLGPLDYYLYNVIERAVGDYCRESGDGRVRCFKLIGVNLLTEGFGAMSHPSAKTHTRMGKELAARLKMLLTAIQ